MRASRLLLVLVPLGLLALLSPSCSSLVRPPSDPPEPTRVFVLYSARHRGLVLPAAEGGWIEYAYGDRDWYALQRDRWYHVFDTVLWPTRATLGRRVLAPGPDGAPAAGGARLVPLHVAAERVHDLRRDLADRYEARRDEEIHNALHGIDFVPTEPGFWFGHNCNDEVGEWLEQLGCEVSGALIRTDLEVDSGS